MTNIDEFSGYKYLPEEAHVARWRFRLFVEMRKSPVYRRLMATLQENSAGPGPGSSRPRHEVEMVEDLNLTKDGEPVVWAFQYVLFDRHGQFDPNNEIDMIRAAQPGRNLSTMLQDTGVSGWMEVHASPLSSWVRAMAPVDNSHNPRYADSILSEAIDHQRLLMMGDQEWQAIEAQAVEAAKALVAAVRREYTERSKTVKAGYEPSREIQIQRLAFRLLKQSGRNPPHIDRRLCRELGIDVPRWK